MSSPVDGPIDAHVEWYYDGQWNDVSDDVDMDAEITVTYGRPDEHGQAESTDISMLMRSELGQCAPEDPAGERYGKIGRGTPVRVRIGDPQPTGSLELPGIDGSYASTPDTAVLDITGDIDVRVDVDPGGRWLDPVHVILLASKFERDSDEASWALYAIDNGIVRFNWWTNGTAASRTNISSTAGIPLDTRRVAVRVTLDVNNGAAGNTVTFYTADTIAGPWTQLGAPVVTAGTTSIYSGTAPVELGSAETGIDPFTGGEPFGGAIYGFELRNGIGGTVVANPDFTALDVGTTSFTDAAGRTWSLHGAAEIVVRDPSIRGTVAAVSWIPTWDETGLDARMAVRGAGILERFGQGREALRSPLTQDLSTAATTVAHWPCEDGSTATSVAPAVGDQALTVLGDVTMAGYEGLAGSGPIPTFGTGGHLVGNVPTYTPNVRQRVACMLHQPDDGTPADRNLIAATCSGGTISVAVLVLKADGSLRIVLRDRDSADVLDFAGGVGDLRGENAMVWMLFTQDGADIDWQIGKIAEGESAVTFHAGTLAGYTYGRFTSINVGSDGDLAGTAVGHVHIVNGDDSEGLWATAFSSLVAWAGERAGSRIRRLCHQEGVPCLTEGSNVDTELLGPQGIDQLLTTLDAAAAVDAGPWGERRDAYSLLYRSRADLYSQAPALTLDMDDGTITPSLSPPLDTQSVRNDVTVTRVNGSSYRAVQQTGPLSIQDPPDGIGGSYPSSPQLHLYTDAQVADQATWRLNLGTTPGHRIARLDIEMEHHPELVQAVLELRNGDLVRILNTPVGLPPGPIDLIVLGTADSITDQTWHVTLNCAPGSPWAVGAVSDGDDEQRLDTAGAELAEDFQAGTDTSAVVTTTVDPLWTTDDAEFPLEVAAGGVVLAVTDIDDGATDTFTRNEVNTWGTATSGQAWNTAVTGAPSNFAVNGTAGTVTMTATQVAYWAVLDLDVTDFDVTVESSVSQSITGAAAALYLAARWTNATNYYFAWLLFNTDGSVDTAIGQHNQVLASADPGLSNAGLPSFSLRFKGVGSQLMAKAWLTSAAEPDAWQVETTHTTHTAGQIALAAQRASGNTNASLVAAVPNLAVANPQMFTVDQAPVNGIEKTIPAGDDVRLAQPIIIAL